MASQLVLKVPFESRDEIFASVGTSTAFSGSTTNSQQTSPPAVSSFPHDVPTKPKLAWPAAYLDPGQYTFLALDNITISDYLERELSVQRLNLIHKHLQYAGLQRPCRPLHQQLSLGRIIRITEKADMHMLWAEA